MGAPQIDLEGWIEAMTRVEDVARDSGLSLPLLCEVWELAYRYRSLATSPRHTDITKRSRLRNRAYEIIAAEQVNTDQALRVVARFFDRAEPTTEETDEFEEVAF